MHCLFLVPRIDKASTRYRILQYLPFLENQGISYSIKELSKKARNWFELAREIRRADIVFIQKKIFVPIEIWLIRRLAKKIVFDIDDSVMFKDGVENASSQRRQAVRFGRMARNADLIICGNEYLGSHTKRWNSNLRFLPTPIDTKRYVGKKSSLPCNKKITLGWIGSRVTLKYLKDIAPALAEVASRFPDTQLKIVADDFFDIEGMEIIKKPWSGDEEIDDLHSFDIGLMPLTEDEWTKGKCGFKLLQCMAVGLPVVCSPVGMNSEIVTDSVDGFWAVNMEEWTEKLAILVGNRYLRETMGAKGRQKVVENYSLEINAKRFLNILNELCLG